MTSNVVYTLLLFIFLNGVFSVSSPPRQQIPYLILKKLRIQNSKLGFQAAKILKLEEEMVERHTLKNKVIQLQTVIQQLNFTLQEQEIQTRENRLMNIGQGKRINILNCRLSKSRPAGKGKRRGKCKRRVGGGGQSFDKISTDSPYQKSAGPTGVWRQSIEN